jgi:hypothetical protein
LPNNLGRTRAEIEAVLAASGLSWTVQGPIASTEHHGHQFGALRALRSGTARLTRATGTSGQAASACRHGLPGPVTLVSEGPNSANPVVRIADRRVAGGPPELTVPREGPTVGCIELSEDI